MISETQDIQAHIIKMHAPSDSCSDLQETLQGSDMVQRESHIAVTDVNQEKVMNEVLMGSPREKGGTSPRHVEHMKELDAKANAQGGRWMTPEEAKIHHHDQMGQPEVQEALRKLHTPEVQEKMKLEDKARHNATDGRW